MLATPTQAAQLLRDSTTLPIDLQRAEARLLLKRLHVETGTRLPQRGRRLLVTFPGCQRVLQVMHCPLSSAHFRFELVDVAVEAEAPGTCPSGPLRKADGKHCRSCGRAYVKCAECGHLSCPVSWRRCPRCNAER